MKKELEVFLQIFLLVSMTVAFSYIVNETFAPVSAQETPSTSNDLFSQFKQEFPTLSDEQIRQAMDQFSTPADMRNALTNMDSDIGTATQNGDVSQGLLDLITWFNRLLPQFPQIDGSSALQGLMDGSGGGVRVCPLTKENAKCQNIIAKDCANRCSVDCLPQDVSKNPLPDDSDCALGTCYDGKEGTCEANSPKVDCPTGNDVEWYKAGDSPLDNLCRKGCCLLAGQMKFATQKECENLINSTGLVVGEEGVGFFSDINTEIGCMTAIAPVKVGACTLPSTDNPGKNDCQFLTDKECEEKTGAFHESYLCSNPDLNTTCTQQNFTKCVEGKDEVYWFDSCGNRENIYDGDRTKSWNNGYALAKTESCRVGDSLNPISNQANCGNCNRLLGTYCGNETTTPIAQELNDNPDGGVVCRDMGCYEKDIFGNEQRAREHGESWCAYDSSIGMPGNDNGNPMGLINLIPKNPLSNLLGGARATDTPGSKHFKFVCQNGEIIASGCEDYRTEVCLEHRTPKVNNSFDLFGGVLGKTYSTASCIMNRAQECFGYNPNQQEGRIVGMAKEKAGLIMQLVLTMTCGQDPACFVKTVDLTDGSKDTFKFSVCLPRVPLGSYTNAPLQQGSSGQSNNPLNIPQLGQSGQGGTTTCSMGTNTCTSVWVKVEDFPLSGAFGGTHWECKANCKCVDKEKTQNLDDVKQSTDFVREMNDLCTSLGDCGYHANYVGAMPSSQGFNLKVSVCGVDDNNCGNGMGSMSDLMSGFGIGILSGANPHPEDANPTDGEYIESTGYADAAGKSKSGFFGSLITPGSELGDVVNRVFQQVAGASQANRVPNVNNNIPISNAAGNGAAGAIPGAIASAVHGANGATGSGLGALVHSGAETQLYVVRFSQPIGRPLTFVATDGTRIDLPADLTEISVDRPEIAQEMYNWAGSEAEVGSLPNNALPFDAHVPYAYGPNVAGSNPTTGGIPSSEIPGAGASGEPINIPGTGVEPGSSVEVVYGGGYNSNPAGSSEIFDTSVHRVMMDTTTVDGSQVANELGTTESAAMSEPAAEAGAGATEAGAGGAAGAEGAGATEGAAGALETGWNNIVAATIGNPVAFAGGIVGGIALSMATGFLINALGIGGGMSPVTTFGLTFAAGVVGAASSYAGIMYLLHDGMLVPSPWQIALIVAVVLVIGLEKLSGVGEMKKVEVKFECKPWSAPQGGDCEKCGEDKLSDGQTKFPCSKYSCETLGQNCVFVADSETSSGGKCISSSLGDTSAPQLVATRDEALSPGFKYDGFVANSGFSVKKDGVECLDSFERITFGFNISEYGSCRISAASPTALRSQVQTGANADSSTKIFDLMKEIPDGFMKEHKVEFNSRDLTNLGYTGTLSSEQRNDIVLYIACQDYLKTDNGESPFEIKLCVSPKDLTATQFLDPSARERLAPYIADRTTLNVNVGERSECRWAKTDMAYEQMTNTFDGECKRAATGNYVCTTEIPLDAGSNNICVKCLDHPEWASGDNEARRNPNVECWRTTIDRSQSPLTITSISPGNGEVLRRGVNPAEVSVAVETAGGVDGTATCSYAVDAPTWIQFATTGSSSHSQTLTQITGSSTGTRHIIGIQCADEAGNNATGSSTFVVQIDITPPNVLSLIFGRLNSVGVVTNEKATCAYITKVLTGRQSECDFTVEDAETIAEVHLMDSNDGGITHWTGMLSGSFYIKCEDDFHNIQTDCNRQGTIS
jgi:hypothetical protein